MKKKHIQWKQDCSVILCLSNVLLILCARLCRGAKIQAQVKHVLVKLHKRLLLFCKLSPSVALLLTASVFCCLVHTVSSLSLTPCLSTSFLHPLSLMLSVLSLLVQYVPTQPSRAKLSWPGPPACCDSNGFNKNTVWWMRIEFHTWTP